VGIIIFIITFVVNYIITASDNGETFTMDLFPSDWFAAVAAIPNILMALTYQINFFPIYKGMRKSNDHRMKMASLTGLVICASGYLLVGILGYSLVGSRA
jgi:amino acid permease